MTRRSQTVRLPQDELDLLAGIVRPAFRAPATARTGEPMLDEEAVARLWQEIARSLPPARPPSRLDRLSKRTFDLVVAAVALVLLSPLLLVIGLLVKLDDRGPALFGQEREGFRGRLFRLWKFRTMRLAAEDLLRNSPTLWLDYVDNDFKVPLASDPRITRIGRYLRRFRLDELPQLWNVLVGDLSLVGPRPVIRTETFWYRPISAELQSVRPGITGVWQVSGGVSYPERACLELIYARRRTFFTDLALLARTVRTLLAGERSREKPVEVRNGGLPEASGER
jgi:exopolysaccharide production protein ExoY